MSEKRKLLGRNAFWHEAGTVFGIILGALLYALGINLFVVPAGLYTGGLMGISQVIRTLLVDYAGVAVSGVDPAGIIYYVMNVPLFLLAFTRLGKPFLAKTVLGVTVMTVGMSLIPTIPVVESDTLTACMVGGIMAGFGTGILLRMSASGGGMDVAGVLLMRWKRDFSVGKANLFVNVLLYVTCFFLFDIQTVIYSVIYAVVYSLVMDRVHTQNINVEATIITKMNTTQLENEVFTELGRGITRWETVGVYTYERSHILYITLSKYEVGRLRAIIQKHDPDAFIVLNEGVRIYGNFLKKL